MLKKEMNDKEFKTKWDKAEANTSINELSDKYEAKKKTKRLKTITFGDIDSDDETVAKVRSAIKRGNLMDLVNWDWISWKLSYNRYTGEMRIGLVEYDSYSKTWVFARPLTNKEQ